MSYSKHAAMAGASLAVAAIAHAAPSTATLNAVVQPVAEVSLVQQPVARLNLTSDDDAVTTSSSLKVAAAQPLVGKLSADDRKKILKDESKIAANAKTIAEAALLSNDKGAVEKAEAVVAGESKSFNVAIKSGDAKKILAVANKVLKEQAIFQSNLIALDRQSLLDRDRVRSDNKFDVAVLSDLGAANALPTDVQSLDYWQGALGSVKTVDFYGKAGELFEVSPEMVIRSYKSIAEFGAGKIAGDAVLKQVFSESKPILEKFGIAGLFGEIAYLQTYKGAPGFGADMRSLEDLALAPFGERTASPVGLGPERDVPTSANAVPEPVTWSLMLVGIGVLGVALRRRHNGLFRGGSQRRSPA